MDRESNRKTVSNYFLKRRRFRPHYLCESHDTMKETKRSESETSSRI
jgi:hypothetical protein